MLVRGRRWFEPVHNGKWFVKQIANRTNAFEHVEQWRRG